MTTTKSLAKRKQSTTQLLNKIDRVIEAVTLQVPCAETTVLFDGEQAMKSVWNDREMELLKIKLLDLVEQL